MKVRTVPMQPHCFCFGGFDIQMLRTLEVMKRNGIDAAPLDFWSRDGDFDVIHVWGLTSTQEIVIKTAKAYGKKVCVTHLAPSLTLYNRLRHVGSYLVTGRRRIELDILKYVDRLFVCSEPQEQSAVRMFGMPREKVEIIPTIIDPLLFDSRALPPFGDLSDYVVCIGNIWPRKNQVRLAQAARVVQCPLLFVGNIMGGENAYADSFMELIERTPYFRWHRWVSEEDLRRIYAHSVGVALPSFVETQPGAALEGAAMRKPLLLGNRPYALQKYYRGAYLANPSSVASIAKGLECVRENPTRHTPPEEFIYECHPDWAGKKFKQIFDAL